MATINEIQTAMEQYKAFSNSLLTAQYALNDIVQKGTIIFNNSTFLELFPEDWNAYQNYLTAFGNLINNFLSNVPLPPSLNS